MPPIYMLKLNRSSIERPQLSYYTQGISAQCIHLQNVTHWSIEKVIILKGVPVSFNLNRHFIGLQRLMKMYCRFLFHRRSLKSLLRREITGTLPKWKGPTTSLY